MRTRSYSPVTSLTCVQPPQQRLAQLRNIADRRRSHNRPGAGGSGGWPWRWSRRRWWRDKAVEIRYDPIWTFASRLRELLHANSRTCRRDHTEGCATPPIVTGVVHHDFAVQKGGGHEGRQVRGAAAKEGTVGAVNGPRDLLGGVSARHFDGVRVLRGLYII